MAATEFGPWTMSAASHECRLNSFWRLRFNALQCGTAKRTSSRTEWIGLLLLLTLMICTPSWQLGAPTAIAQEQEQPEAQPFVESVPTQHGVTRGTVSSASARAVSSLSKPDEVENKSAVPVPAVRRPWQLVNSSQLPASDNVTLMAGQLVNIDMPRGGKLSTSGAKGVFSSKLDETSGDILIQGEKSGVGGISFSHGERKKVNFQVVVVTDPAPLKDRLDKEVGLGHITITPGVQSVILSGNVKTPDELKRCIALADDLYPHVVNNIQIRHDQQVMLNCRIFEFTTTEAGLTDALEQLF